MAIGKEPYYIYASNVNTTTQQLIQAEIAVNRHVSLLVTQDESGIFSMVRPPAAQVDYFTQIFEPVPFLQTL